MIQFQKVNKGGGRILQFARELKWWEVEMFGELCGKIIDRSALQLYNVVTQQPGHAISSP
jgi:hypothetical protein